MKQTYLHKQLITIATLIGLLGCNQISGIEDIQFADTETSTHMDADTTSDSTTTTTSPVNSDTLPDDTSDTSVPTDPTGQGTDSDTKCVSTGESSRSCTSEGDVLVLDNCGNEIETITCNQSENTTCRNGQCDCAPGWHGQNCDSCTIYVKSGLAAYAGNDGQSWEKAVETVQGGISLAQPLGCEVWVAHGSYYPTKATNETNGRTVTIQLAANIALYGGFLGDELKREERNVEQNTTILSGDIGIPINSNDNAYHVVTGADNAILNGFTVTAGNADGEEPYDRGAGMYNNAVSPIVTNCIFTQNTATENYAAGIENEHEASPVISHCTFSTNNGQAISNFDHSNPFISHCLFEKNTKTAISSTSYSSGKIANCLFVGNDSTAISASGFTAPYIYNCTFVQNNATGSAGAIYVGLASHPKIYNSIFWDNTSKDIYLVESDYLPPSVTVSYSNVQNGYEGTGNIDEDPRFFNANNGDFRLSSSSPCIDAGDNSLLPPDVADLDDDGEIGENIPVDLDGNPRISSSNVDMGAYEFQN